MAGDKPTSIRFTAEDEDLMTHLEQTTSLSRVQVVRLALRVLKRTLDVAPAVVVQVLPADLAQVKELGGDRPGRKKKD